MNPYFRPLWQCAFLFYRKVSHCVKSVRIQSYSGPHFPAFGLDAERYGVSTLLKRSFWQRCFPVNFTKFLKTPFFTEHLRWLLLCFQITNHKFRQHNWRYFKDDSVKALNGFVSKCFVLVFFRSMFLLLIFHHGLHIRWCNLCAKIDIKVELMQNVFGKTVLILFWKTWLYLLKINPRPALILDSFQITQFRMEFEFFYFHEC